MNTLFSTNSCPSCSLPSLPLSHRHQFIDSRWRRPPRSAGCFASCARRRWVRPACCWWLASGLVRCFCIIRCYRMAWPWWVAWISWLGWKLFNAPASGIEVETSGNCPGAIHGAGLQLNPKTWMMALSVVSVFVGAGSGPATYGLYAAIFLLVALPCLTVWALLGRGAARLLASPRAIRCFNQGMALLLVTSAWISVLR